VAFSQDTQVGVKLEELLHLLLELLEVHFRVLGPLEP